MIRKRNSSWRYSHAVETFASAATVRKLMAWWGASIRCCAARARPIACSLRSRALCLRPVVFLRMELFQGRDDVDEVVSLSLVHFDLANASMLICLGDHPLCLSKF